MESNEYRPSSTQSSPGFKAAAGGKRGDRLRGAARLTVYALNELPIVLGSMLMMGISAAIFANVIARYFFGSSIVWSDEASRFALVWICFLGAATLVRWGQHISVELFVRLMPVAVQNALYVLSQLLVAGASIILIWYGIVQVMMQSGQISPALELSMGLVYAVAPLTGMYILMYSLANLVAFGIRGGMPRPDLDRLEL